MTVQKISKISLFLLHTFIYTSKSICCMLLKSDFLSYNTGHHEDIYSTLQSFRQQLFIKHDFHFLNVSRVGTFTVYDEFDCTFEYLINPLCFSVNLAASKGANGELWCELLSSDKYRDVTGLGTEEIGLRITLPLRLREFCRVFFLFLFFIFFIF